MRAVEDATAPTGLFKKSTQETVGEETVLPLSTNQLGIWALLGTLSMLFAGFASAYLVRRAGADWQRVPLPGILWINTIVLLSSSVTLEVARSAERRGQAAALKGWLLITTLLGLAFLGGQLMGWRQLAARGVYLPTSPYSSFFYMLTAVHGAHLLGGILALGYALWRVWRARWTPAQPERVNGCATYWHFVDGVWVFLYLLMLRY